MLSGNRRKETRIEIELSLPIKKISVGEDKVVSLNKILPVKTVDLSAGGILLQSFLDLPEYLKLYLTLPIDNDAIPCIADIVRKEKKQDEFYYGCKLTFPSEAEKYKVRKFVFKKQLQRIRFSAKKMDPRKAL